MNATLYMLGLASIVATTGYLIAAAIAPGWLHRTPRRRDADGS